MTMDVRVGHMRKRASRTAITVATLAIAVATLAIGVAVGVLILVFRYTPTTTLRIENDTAEQVTLSGCASDPATVNHGQTVTIDPSSNDRHAACIVYLGETRQVLGCLLIPTTQYRTGSSVKLSLYERGVAASLC